MNSSVTNNYSKIRLSKLYLPILIILGIAIFLFSQNALNANNYANIQKSTFLFLNSELSQYPNLQYNLTQIGDAFIALSLLSVFVLYAPKIWEALLSASFISLFFSKALKSLFGIPRPAAIFDNNDFTIIGEKLIGHSSFPSGHSITIFTTFTVLMFAFAPKQLKNKFLYYTIFIFVGLFIALTRVGVGAHYPIDVIMGCILGYISGVLGVYFSQKYNVWSWISNKKFYPIFIGLFLGSTIFLIYKIINKNLIIFYFPLLSLIFSLYTITKSYVKEIRNFKK